MGTVNQVFLVGRLGKDPELLYTQSGKAICKFSLATNRLGRRGTEPQGEEPPPDWHRVVAWERLAETCGKYLSKGKQVAVVGAIRYDKYTDKEGVTKYFTEIRAQNVTFLSPKAEQSPVGGYGGEGQPSYGHGGTPAVVAPAAPMRPLVQVESAAAGPGGSDDIPF